MASTSTPTVCSRLTLLGHNIGKFLNKVKTLCLNCHLGRWRLTCTLVCPLKRPNYWQTWTTKGLQRKCFPSKHVIYDFPVDFLFWRRVGCKWSSLSLFAISLYYQPPPSLLASIFFVVGRSWERVLLLPSHLTSYYFVYSIYHTQPSPTLQLHWFFCGGGSESECFSFFFNPITPPFFIHHSTSSSSFLLAGFFNEKFRLIDWGWSVWRAASTIRLKFCFLTITQMFLNGIDWYLEH